MRKVVFVLLVAAVTLFGVGQAAQAITYGEPDGNAHPEVGAVIVTGPSGAKGRLCSGTLLSPTVFLTAAHCTDYLESLGVPNDQIWVSFDADVRPVTAETTLYQGRWVTNPGYNQRQSDPGDLAVILFDTPIEGRTPAALPTAGLFNQMKATGTLNGTQFTAVGYGVLEPTIGGGPMTFPYEGERRRAVSGFSALNDAWLRLSQNDATGDGGTCNGDSGGPNFLGAGATETNVVAAVTVTGDTNCMATNTTYRLDTPQARAFLGAYVSLP